ncbi:MAG: bacillithiol biosynthesis cysteine-adding enzyme BshC [Bacteroidota bacterium]
MNRSIRADYWSGDANLRPFYAHDLSASPQELIAARENYPVDRALLVSALRRQHKGLEVPHQVSENIQLLSEQTTFTITTGQQPALFGGPLYNLYKALTVIKLAKRYKAQLPEYDFVPVFWNATEDHDRNELNHTWLTFPKPVRYEEEFTGAVGRHVIREAIKELDAPPELVQVFAPGKRFGDAFRDLWYKWLGEYGLVIIDADDPDLKPAFRPIAQREIEQGLGEAIARQSEKLKAAGYSAQLKPGDENLFLLRENFREQLFRGKDGFFTRKGKLQFSTDELLQLLENEPDQFSPNAALRTLYQENLLPNLVYVGGWGEISYWLQLKAVFDETHTFFPLLIPRASAFLLPESTAESMANLGLSLSSLQEPEGWMRNRLRELHWQDSLAYRDFRIQQEALHARISAHITPEQPHLHASVEANLQRNRQFLEQLERRMSNAYLQRMAGFNSLIQCKRALSADGYVQERTLNPWVFLREQPEELIAFIADKLAVDEPAQQLIVLPKHFGRAFA